MKTCGAFAVNGTCVLEAGHNKGKADIPENHRARLTGSPADRAFDVDKACPECGQKQLLGYTYVSMRGNHQHTHYICTFWPTGQFTEKCGWSGWTIPNPEMHTYRIEAVINDTIFYSESIRSSEKTVDIVLPFMEATGAKINAIERWNASAESWETV